MNFESTIADHFLTTGYSRHISLILLNELEIPGVLHKLNSNIDYQGIGQAYRITDGINYHYTAQLSMVNDKVDDGVFSIIMTTLSSPTNIIIKNTVLLGEINGIIEIEV